MGKNKVFVGWDTETVGGRVVLLTSSKKDILWLDYDITGEYWEEDDDGNYVKRHHIQIKEGEAIKLLDLLIQFPKVKYVNYFYNLDYDIKAIMITIIDSITDEKERMEQLQNFVKFKYFYFQGYKMEYVAGKFFNVAKGGTEQKYFFYKNNKKIHGVRTINQQMATYMDIAQFYKMSLKKASKQYLNLNKLDFDVAYVDPWKLKHDKSYREEFLTYCLKDSLLCKLLAAKWYNLIYSFTQIHIYKMLSPAYISKRYLRKYLKDNDLERFYTNHHIKNYENEILASYYGGHFEVIKKGYHPKLYCYDINSAYPKTISELRQLLPYTKEDTTLRYKDERCYDLVKVKIHFYHYKLNPLAFRQKDGLLYYPAIVKPMEKWVTQYDLDLLDIYGVEYDIERVIHFYHNDRKLFPFVTDLYELRRDMKNPESGDGYDVQEKVIKQILNSFYGISLETIKKFKELSLEMWRNVDEIDKDILVFGDNAIFIQIVKNAHGQMYQPFWGSWITSACRRDIVKQAVVDKQLNKVWKISTDGLFIEEPLNVPISNKLGDWSEDILRDCVIYGNGLYVTEGEFKTRGYNNKTLKEFQSMVTTGKFEKQMLVPLSWYMSRDFKDLHTFKKVEKKFSIADRKRLWGKINLDEIRTKVFDSEPLVFDSQPRVVA